mgnify:CR=1 FL=1
MAEGGGTTDRSIGLAPLIEFINHIVSNTAGQVTDKNILNLNEHQVPGRGRGEGEGEERGRGGEGGERGREGAKIERNLLCR